METGYSELKSEQTGERRGRGLTCVSVEGPEREECSLCRERPIGGRGAPEDMEGFDLGPAKELALARKEGQEDEGFLPPSPATCLSPPTDSSHSLCHQWTEAWH